MTKTIIAVCALISALGYGYVVWQWHAPRVRGGAPPVAVTIPQGSSAREIGRILKEHNLIRSRFWFERYVWFRDRESAFQAGDFEVQPGSVARVVGQLTGFGASADLRITIIEGWDLAEIAKALKPIGVTPEDFFVRAGRPPYLRRSKGYEPTLEGYLFPDTYFFRRGASAAEIITRLRENFKRRVGDVPNLHETITIASLLQAEVRSDADMRRVADIIRRRLAAGRGLQVDATVNYLTGKNSAGVSAADFAIDSPYNTYRYRGLPPGPINNPGLQAIRAAQNPLANPYWYYLTGKNGTVHYARTLDEHRANRKYL